MMIMWGSRNMRLPRHISQPKFAKTSKLYYDTSINSLLLRSLIISLMSKLRRSRSPSLLLCTDRGEIGVQDLESD
jgi:hypothetical protein